MMINTHCSWCSALCDVLVGLEAAGCGQFGISQPELEPLARISHQVAQDTDKTFAFLSKVRVVKNTACYSSTPITVQAGLRARMLALHSNRSYRYAFHSRAALSNTNPAPAPVILVRNAG